MLITTLIIVWIICAFIGAWLAGEKGRGLAGFWLGFFFGPIGIIIALLLAPKASIKPVEDHASIADLKALLHKKAKTGISLSVADGRTITSVADGSPAQAAGICTSDRLVAIDDQLTANDYKENVMRLVGEPETTVRVSVRRGESAHDFTLIRQ